MRHSSAQKLHTIVYTWVENTGLAPTGEMYYDSSYGIHRERLKPVNVGKSVMWLNAGTAADVRAARAYAAQERASSGYDMSRFGYKLWNGVFVYPTTEKHPLARARADALAAYEKSLGKTRKAKRVRANPRLISWQKPTASQKKWGIDLVGHANGYLYEIESERVRGTEYHEVYVIPPAGSFGGGVREKVCSRGTLALAKACAEQSAARSSR